MNTVTKSGLNVMNSLFRGLAFAIVSLLILTVLFSLILWLSGIKEAQLSVFAYVIHILSLLIGGFVSGKRGGSKGWYHGGILGFVYFIIILLVGYLGFDASLDLGTLLLLGISLISASFGGIVGVNMNKS